MITLKLGTLEWQLVWNVVSAFVENERADGIGEEPAVNYPEGTATHVRCKMLKVGEAIMGEMDREMPIKVLLTTHAVRCKPFGGAGRRYCAKLTSRGTWSEMYKSKPCSTEREARDLAEKYLAKNADWLVLS